MNKDERRPGQGKGKRARSGDACAICDGPARIQCNMCFTWCCNQCLQESCLRHVSGQQTNTNPDATPRAMLPGGHTREVIALTAAFWTAWQKITAYPLFPLVTLIQESTTVGICSMLVAVKVILKVVDYAKILVIVAQIAPNYCNSTVNIQFRSLIIRRGIRLL